MTAKPRFALVTGCSAGGIGAALAQVFLESGYHVFATARNPSKVPETLASSSNVSVVSLDVVQPESIAACLETVRRKSGGRLDVLVNNAGAGIMAPGLDTPIDEAKRLFDLNFWAALAMLQAFAPLLIAAKGCLVNNSSASIYVNFPFGSIYNGSKGALASASETWRQELQPLGVRVITLITTGVQTQFFSSPAVTPLPETSPYYPVRDFIASTADGRLQKGAISAREYAVAVVKAIEGGKAGIVWAGTDSWMGRFMGLLPQFVLDMVAQSLVPIAKEMAKAGHPSPS